MVLSQFALFLVRFRLVFLSLNGFCCFSTGSSLFLQFLADLLWFELFLAYSSIVCGCFDYFDWLLWVAVFCMIVVDYLAYFLL
jgi:hypothetical protein